MKPSKIKTLKAKKAWFLLSHFQAITWKGIAYCHSKTKVDDINASDKIDSQLKSHETIHIRQAESTHDSWFRFYIRYIWEQILNFPLIFINIYAPYKFTPMEIEAYLNQDNWDYCKHGATYQWKEFEKILTLKEKREMAKEYYGSKPKPYFTHFLYEKLNNRISLS